MSFVQSLADIESVPTPQRLRHYSPCSTSKPVLPKVVKDMLELNLFRFTSNRHVVQNWTAIVIDITPNDE